MGVSLIQGEFMSPSAKHVWVYGGDHSPWVQAVLLGLHEKAIPHTVTTVPPLSVFLHSGILMPAVKIDEGPWVFGSAQILSQFGFSKVDDADQRALQLIFGAGALQRTLRAWDFWNKWSYLRDGHDSLLRRNLHHILRPFSVFYFFTVITLARTRTKPPTDGKLAKGFTYWERRLDSGTTFLGGEAPDTVDVQLFGQLQMFASIPGRSLHVLQETPDLDGLRAWIERMQARFSAYNHLYSGPFFQPKLAPPAQSPPIERIPYWIGCALVWLLFPLSLAATLFFAALVDRRNLR